MSRITVIQHSPFEPLGIMIDTLRKMKMRLRYINFHREPIKNVKIEDYSGLILLGGNMNPDQLNDYPHLKHEITLIEQALKLNIPVLGICLGSQLLNLVLGGECYRLRQLEFGWSEVTKLSNNPLFTGFPTKIMVFQWHQYANRLAIGTDKIFENSRCVQAFCYDNKHIGLQFHLEVDNKLILRWLEHPSYLTHLKAHMSEEEVTIIKHQTKLFLNRSIAMGSCFFEQVCYMMDCPSGSFNSMHAGR